jgi:hypothetical protein
VSHRNRSARGLAVAATALLLAAGGPSASISAPAEVLVRASPAFAPCLEPALAAFSRESGVRATLEVGEPDPPAGADLVVGDDSELTRLLEGGTADLATATDLGYLPWVLVVPAGTPAGVAAATAAADQLTVLGGRLGREARAALGGRLAGQRLRVSNDREELRSARFALVPRSLAGPGERRPAGVRSLVAVAAVVGDAPHAAAARQLLAFLKSPRGHAALGAWLSESGEPGAAGTPAGARGAAAASAAYATSVVDWWLPQCTLDHNGYNDPQQTLGPPDAVSLGAKDQYRGFMSLGQGGYVTLDLGIAAVDGPGADVRVYQTVSNEPVTVYAAPSPQGPFALLGLRVSCGVRTPGVFSNHCDFDLHDAGLTEARYLKVEDGEIYPCLEAGTITEGADIDAVEVLNQKQ